MRDSKRHTNWGKQLFNLAIVVPLVIILSPLLVLIGFMVRMRMGTSVLFCQVRPGLHGKPFVMYKFRTMTNARNHEGKLLPDEQRLTSLGRVLRNTSLDELPQLINILKSEMNFVGPRPLASREYNRYSSEQRRRYDVLPGITGWAQIHGRNETTWEERLARDCWYVDHRSLKLDFRIILTTFKILLQGDGGLEKAESLGEYMGPGIEPKRKWEPYDQDSM
jgi:lipopolysaccharide/colanic/teichoic acid biosynthesis glycosyltransferase